MRELSLNILDIAQNSVTAGAKNIDFCIQAINNLLTITISDDGCGMSDDFVQNVIDPFTTTRTTRKVGMGIPLLKLAAETAGGTFNIKSQVGKGTTTSASFVIDNIDRMPLGNLSESIVSLILTAPHINYTLKYAVDGREFLFSTKEVKEVLDGVPIESAEIIQYIIAMLQENINEINGGILL